MIDWRNTWFLNSKSAGVFDVSIQEWRMIPNMSTESVDPGVGVLTNHLYAVTFLIIIF